MLAIPVFRSRVAPVFNWCSRVLVFHDPARDSSVCEEMLLTDVKDSFERLRVLQEKGITTLVCGALSVELLRYAESLTLNVICGVAGGVKDVLVAYREDNLDQPRFRLPGCRCNRRPGSAERRSTMRREQGGGFRQGQGKGWGKNQGGTGRMGGKGAGPGGDCLCLNCGTAAPHKIGIPCTHMTCPRCGQPMARQ